MGGALTLNSGPGIVSEGAVSLVGGNDRFRDTGGSISVSTVLAHQRHQQEQRLGALQAQTFQQEGVEQ